MLYQRRDLKSGRDVGAPAPLPPELVGLSDANLADLSCIDPTPETYVGQGFFPAGDAPAEPSAATYVVDIPTFMLRFQPLERIAIRTSKDALVVDFMQLLDDPRTLRINLQLPAVQQGVGYLASLDPPLIAPERVPDILAPEGL